MKKAVLVLCLLVAIAAGCASPSREFRMSENDLETIRQKALTLVANGGEAAEGDTRWVIYKGQLRSDAPIGYVFRAGKQPRVVITVPVADCICFDVPAPGITRIDLEFDPQSHALTGVMHVGELLSGSPVLDH